MKIFLFGAFILLSIRSIGQTTDAIVVTGKVKQELTIRLTDLAAYPQQKIKKFKITNHKGENKGEIKKMTGVSVLDLLQKVEFDVDNPKLLSEYYLVFEAFDGYKVVYSWNEIFNSDTGKHIFVVTSKDGEPAATMPQTMLVVTPSDIQTGRRYIKNVAHIVVKKVE